jgi:hypothetical protein
MTRFNLKWLGGLVLLVVTVATFSGCATNSSGQAGKSSNAPVINGYISTSASTKL